MSLEPLTPEEGNYRKLEARVARFLWVGTLVSAVLIAVGLVMSFAEGPHALHAIPLTATHIWAGLKAGHPIAYETLGIVVLLALPVVRVAIACAGFLRRKEPALAAIALSVLGVIAVSFFLGGAHGG